ncbi:MAG: hypothetical protein ACREIA_02340 [Opitutaceae bacterium]
MKTTLSVFIAASAVALFSGCISSGGRTVYTRSHINQAYSVELGTVIGARSVVIEGQASQVGTYGGGAVGAIGGSQVGGGGVGSALSGAAGGVVGMAVGQQVEKALTRKPGLEITILLDNGDTVVVMQEESRGGFQDGDRVRVMIGQGSAFVLH